jgi:hypothetical protein
LLEKYSHIVKDEVDEHLKAVVRPYACIHQSQGLTVAIGVMMPGSTIPIHASASETSKI